MSLKSGSPGPTLLAGRRRRTLIFLISLVLVFLIYFQFYGGLESSRDIFTRKPYYRWNKEFIELNGPRISASDPALLRKLSSHHLHKIKSPTYNLSNMTLTYDPSMGQSQVIRNYFNEKRNGFFIECGALDGETRSNTLYLERALGWEGLLIEADPDNYKELEEKGRRVWSSNSCLSTKSWPEVVSFNQAANQGKISGFTAGYIEKNYVDVQCYPLESYLTYLNRTIIDYFSLDVEGLELEILKTIDFDRFDVKTLSVEFIHDKEGKVAIKEFMREKGYKVLTEVTHPNWLANDFIFVKDRL